MEDLKHKITGLEDNLCNFFFPLAFFLYVPYVLLED
jgi:hypothetical protein